MIKSIKGDVSDIINKNKFDIIIYMNNSVGDWGSATGLALAKLFPSSKANDYCNFDTYRSMLGKSSRTVTNEGRKELFFNVHVRPKDINMMKADEVANLAEAMGNQLRVMHGKTILIITGRETNRKDLLRFCELKLGGNTVKVL